MLNRKRAHWPVLGFLVLGLSTPVEAQGESAPAPAALTVTISSIPNDKGQIGCSLYSKADGFPSKPGKADRVMFVQAKAKKATCVFKIVKPGKYAISVMHDENKDGKLETSMVGRPKEAWGVSNNVPPERFGPPKYEAATFSYTGEPKTMQVKLRL